MLGSSIAAQRRQTYSLYLSVSPLCKLRLKTQKKKPTKAALIFECILDVVFPARCAVCDQVLPFGEKDICKSCSTKMQYLGNQVCLRCGKGVKEGEEYCYDCSRRKHDFDQGRALFSYEFIRLSLYRFKYAGRKEYARFYAKNIAGKFREQKQIWKPQALLPVPIHSVFFPKQTGRSSMWMK